MQLLGISKAPFYRFLSALVHRLAPLRQPVRILAFLAVFPDMPSDRFLALGIAGTARQQGATAAQIRIRLIMPIAFTAGRAVEQSLALRADVVVLFRVVLILAFVKIPLAVTGSAIAEYRLDVLVLQPFADRRNVVTGIKPHMCHLETKAILLALYPLKIRNRIVNIARGDMHIGDDIGLAIHRAVIQIEQPLAFAFTGHVASLRISRTLLAL